MQTALSTGNVLVAPSNMQTITAASPRAATPQSTLAARAGPIDLAHYPQGLAFDHIPSDPFDEGSPPGSQLTAAQLRSTSSTRPMSVSTVSASIGPKPKKQKRGGGLWQHIRSQVEEVPAESSPRTAPISSEMSTSTSAIVHKPADYVSLGQKKVVSDQSH